MEVSMTPSDSPSPPQNSDETAWEDMDGPITNSPILLPKAHRTRHLKIPRDPEILARNLARYLRRFDRQLGGPAVHHYPITFTDGVAKANWIDSLSDGADRETFSTWWHAPKHNRFTWLGCFSTWTRTWVGDEDWDGREWHVWAVAAIKMPRGKGKAVIIYDCDPRFPEGYVKGDSILDARPHTFLLQMQWKLLRYLRLTRKVKVNAVFYNTSTSRAGQDRCLYNTMRWMRKIVEFGDDPFWGFDEQRLCLDPRTKGFALITRK